MQLNGDGDNNKKLTHVLSELTFYARTVIAIIHYRIIFFSTALFVLVLSVLMYLFPSSNNLPILQANTRLH